MGEFHRAYRGSHDEVPSVTAIPAGQMARLFQLPGPTMTLRTGVGGAANDRQVCMICAFHNSG